MIIGLTGGIACGKSTIADRIISYGIDSVDADIVAREVVAPGQPALTTIRDYFGSEVINHDGTLNRKELRRHIFNKINDRKWLEGLLHPLIRQELMNQLAACNTPYCLLIAPLLFENSLEKLTDRVLVIDIPQAMQVERATKRDQMSIIQAEQIIQAQISREKRLNMADDIINNAQSLEHVYPQVDKLHEIYLKLAKCDDSHPASY